MLKLTSGSPESNSHCLRNSALQDELLAIIYQHLCRINHHNGSWCFSNQVEQMTRYLTFYLLTWRVEKRDTDDVGKTQGCEFPPSLHVL